MGQEERTYLSHPLFPNSLSEPFEISSPETTAYNCLAWAVHDSENWWEPGEGYLWKEGIPEDGSIDSIVRFLQSFGFEIGNSPNIEDTLEKVALFSNGDGYVIHLARQLPNGKWTSKLGASHDVEHSLKSMEGGMYGNVVLVMERERH